MGRSAGAGSPVWFRCHACRSTLVNNTTSTFTLTGRRRPYNARRGHSLGSRSSYWSREYRCTCGHVGWSNHIDLERMERADASTGTALRRA